VTTRRRSLFTDTRLIAVGLLIGLGLIYLPTVAHAFVWDDLTFVRVLWPLRDPASWGTAIQQPFPITPGYFRPLGVLFLTVEFSLAGRNPALFHLVSVALLLLNTALVAWLARLAWPEQRSAPIVALLLYGLHPALIEGVSFISSQFDLLVTTCLLLALIAAAKIQRRWLQAAIVGLLFLLAASIKEMAVVLVLVLPLWQLSRDQSIATWRSHFKERLPTYLAVLGAGAIYLVLRINALGSLLPSAVGQVPSGDVLQHLLLIARSFAEYLLVSIWPFGTLSPIHFSTLPITTNDGLAWLSMAIVLAVIGVLIYWIRRAPRSGWLALAAGLSLLPVINIIPLNLTGGAFVAERFLVFPLALLVLAISGPLASWALDSQRLWRAVVFGLWCVACIVMLAVTTPKWADGLSFWTWASERAPQSSMAWGTLANEYVQRGDYATGLEAAQRALDLNANDEWAWNNAGQALFGLGRIDEARAHIEQAVQLNPAIAIFWNNLGGIDLQQGQWLPAEQNFLKALSLDPNEPLAHLNLGALYLQTDRPDLALPHLETALRLMPDDPRAKAQALLDRANQPDAWMRLVDQQLQQQDAAAAWRALAAAERRGADAIDVAVGRCTILIARTNLPEAEAACQAAASQAPNDARPYNNLGVIARQRGEVAAARQFFQRAIDLQPDWDLPRQNLAQLPPP
jgi:Flp pilus assembly protein TadD